MFFGCSRKYRPIVTNNKSIYITEKKPEKAAIKMCYVFCQKSISWKYLWSKSAFRFFYKNFDFQPKFGVLTKNLDV